VNDIVNELKERLEKIHEELHKLPAGRLKKRRNFYYHAIDGKDIGITKNPQLIQKLCRKKHLLNYKKQLENNISFFSRNSNKFDETTQEEMIRSLPSTYKELPDYYFLYLSSLDDWLAKPYEKNPFQLKKEEGYTTEKGITFRSKSEYIIAITLDYYNIPYRYEAAIHLDEQQTKYPDFTILNPFNGTLIILEHFGALHQPGYVQEMNDKIFLYMKHGYVLFETLICTFEPDIKDTIRLRALIENIILKP